MYTYKATVNRVVNGNTIDLQFKTTTFQRIRLRDINTPKLIM
nr:hypothetical protein [uncultured Draconibacterium sp.]